MLGRYDEALATWRTLARVQRDTALATALAAAHGESGYWAVSHAQGRKRLAGLRDRTGYVSPLRYVQAYFAAGYPDSAYVWLDRTEKAGVRQLYRLQCMAEIDEYRNTPRFREAIERIGALAP